MKDLKKRIYEIIEIGNKTEFISKLFDYFIVVVIVTNLLVTLLMTFDEMACFDGVLKLLELITIIIFTIEYILRVWTSDIMFPGKSKISAAFSFIFSFYGLIDLLTFFPYYLPIVFPAGVVAFRMFRVVRIFRLFKINAQYDAFNVILEVIKEKKNQLFSSVVMIFIFMVASSLIMYSLEHDAQPEQFKNAFSGIWWSVSTLLTVGYGDIYPVTFWGRAMAVIIAFLGVGMVAVPTGIISAGFVEQYTKIKTYRGSEHELQFVVSEVTENHPWSNKQIKEIVFPPQLILVMIIRHGEVIVPKGNTVLYENDRLVIGARNYRDEVDISLKEILIEEENPWIGMRVKDLDIPKDELMLMIRRRNTTLVPNGSTIIRQGDGIVMFTYINDKKSKITPFGVTSAE